MSLRHDSDFLDFLRTRTTTTPALSGWVHTYKVIVVRKIALFIDSWRILAKKIGFYIMSARAIRKGIRLQESLFTYKAMT